MKLKTRLWIAFMSIIILPILLFCLIFFGYGTVQLRSIERTYGIEFSVGSLMNNMQAISDSTNGIYEEMEEQAKQDPDQFDSFSYLQSVNEQLEQKLSFLLVMEGEKISYQGRSGDLTDLVEHLPADSGDKNSAENGIYVGGKERAMVKNLHVELSDSSIRNVYIVTPASATIPQLKSLLVQMLFFIIAILAVTGALFAMWIYNGVSAPIAKLRVATKRIASGDLDFTVERTGVDEIGDLCNDFETMRKKLAQSEHDKSRYDRESRELISNISHDLKTPITTVKGYVEGIMDGVADTPEKMDRYIKTIYSKANDMDRLINELTFYSKIDTNRIPYTFARLNVAEYFDDCAEEVSMDLEDRGILFTYENTVDRKTEIIADAEQLKRVINNIIGNSVKYMDKARGRINLSIRDAGDFVQIDIEDNGKGIDVKDLPNIFDRSFRTDEARSSSQGGSGIGLSIVRKIIEDHSGRIWASSRLEQGTTMHFVIRKYQEVSNEQSTDHRR